MNRMLLKRAQCILSNAGLSKCFWAEAVNTACYSVNQSPFTAIDFKAPEEVWSDTPTNYSHLRVFGCPAYFHVNDGSLNLGQRKLYFLVMLLG